MVGVAVPAASVGVTVWVKVGGGAPATDGETQALSNKGRQRIREMSRREGE